MTRPHGLPLLPHAQASLSLTSDGIEKIATYLGAIGNYTVARALQQQNH